MPLSTLYKCGCNFSVETGVVRVDFTLEGVDSTLSDADILKEEG